MNSPSVLLINFCNGESLRSIKELVSDGVELIVVEKQDREEVLKKVLQTDYMMPVEVMALINQSKRSFCIQSYF